MTHSYQQTLRLGTRGSRLALAQSQQIADALQATDGGLCVELVVCKTTGDRIIDRPLRDIGGKGLFVKELEEALLNREVDFAVHSFKDLPVTEPLVDESELIIAAVPPRADCRDVLSSAYDSIAALPAAAIVGTGSMRRRCQLLTLRPDLHVKMVRGNVDTRLTKLTTGEFAAIVLAAAGLHRCGLFDARRDKIIEPHVMLPAAAQGALALQCLREDSQTIDILKRLDDPQTRLCTDLERAVVAELNGDCHSPIAALGMIVDDQFWLRARVGRRDGDLPVIEAEAKVSNASPIDALHSVIDQLHRQDVRKLLAANA